MIMARPSFAPLASSATKGVRIASLVLLASGCGLARGLLGLCGEGVTVPVGGGVSMQRGGVAGR